MMAYLKQHPSDIRIKIRDVTSVRDLDDDETGEQIARGVVYLDEDEAGWLVDTFDEMVTEIETLRLDVASALSRANHAEQERDRRGRALAAIDDALAERAERSIRG